MNKNLQYYLKLPYDIHIETVYDEIAKEKVYYAYIDELGRFACYGEGRSIKEALKSLEEVKKDLISYYITKGTPIPEPEPKIEKELPSGNFVVRTAPLLHMQLAEQAKRAGVSLNLFVNNLLAQNLAQYQLSEIKDYFDVKFNEIQDCFEQSKSEVYEYKSLKDKTYSDKFKSIQSEIDYIKSDIDYIFKKNDITAAA
jgi:predicted HicB family RNase H-like nuclease